MHNSAKETKKSAKQTKIVIVELSQIILAKAGVVPELTSLSFPG